MIDWCKRCVCDSCDVTSSRKNPINTYTIKLNRTGKSFTLCENCVKELYETVQDIMQKEGIE